MDEPVALVETYLRLHGYFTVTEYPVVEAFGGRAFRASTDLDILAVRFPGAGWPFAFGRGAPREEFVPDPHLGTPRDEVDMIIGEVKEGRAELNRGATDPRVLCAALARFGCCPPDHAAETAARLVRKGIAHTHSGHRVRLVAFGSTHPDGPMRYSVVQLGQVTAWLESYIDQNWALVSQAHFKDPAFALLVTLAKARRGVDAS